MTAAIAVRAQPALDVRQTGIGVELSWIATEPYTVEATTALIANTVWEPVNEVVTVVDGRRFLLLPATDATRFFRLRAGALAPVTVAGTSPAAGEGGVAVTRETVFRLDAPLAAGAQLGGDRLFAEAAGRRILARPELSADRQTLSLFYLENLPAGARVEVTLDGTGWTGAAGEPVDFDGDGLPGGATVLRF
jgi:hypothetical protein